MSNKNRIYIVIIILLMFPFFLIRVFNHFKIKNLETELVYYSEELKNEFFDHKMVALSEVDTSISNLFNKLYRDSISISDFDTSLNFLYITSKVTYSAHDIRYIDCLIEKCNADINNDVNQENIDNKKNYLKSKYLNSFNKWFPNFENKLSGKKSNLGSCELFFRGAYVSYVENDWLAFEKLLVYHNKEVKSQEKNNKSEINKFNNLKRQRKRNLKSKYHAKFDLRMGTNKSSILDEKNIMKTYSSDFTGDISFYVDVVEFNENEFDKVSEKVFEEQWKTNSLRTGSMPYATCYGSSNYGSSRIEVENSGQDVIVLVKNSSNKVVRHVYINGNDSFTIKIPNGRYSVFFYNGKGWNPYKKMKKTYCGIPKGGFVSSESFSKDDSFYISNQILTYTLKPVNYGNFTPEGSSMNEAF